MTFIILDRDGVINYDSEEYIKSPEEWLAIPGSLNAIAKLNQAGFKILIATNQSGLGRGYYDRETLNLIHEKLINELSKVGGFIEEIFVCPHLPEEKCFCRKPNPGLLYNIQKKYSIDLTSTFFIGDSLVDVQAAQTAGCLPLLVLTGNGLNALNNYPELTKIPNFSNLAEAVEHILFVKKKNQTL